MKFPWYKRLYYWLFRKKAIHRVFPELLANKLVGVQPMTGPVGLAYAMRFITCNRCQCIPYTKADTLCSTCTKDIIRKKLEKL